MTVQPRRAYLRPFRQHFLSVLIFLVPMCVAAPGGFGQTIDSVGNTAATSAVPRLIRYSSTLIDGRGYPLTVPVDVTFSLYGQQSIGSKPALWQETQHVLPNEKGAYTVYLGGASASGLPGEVFTSVTAQWLGIRVEGETELSRVLLASVPYALKAGDAQTLGGLPASAFVLAGSQLAATMTTASIAPDAGTTVTTTGGTSGYLPQFTGASTVGNSQVFVSSAGVAINKTSPAAVLDVNGDMIVRGPTIVARTGNATSAKGYPSYGFDFYSNVYNSSTKVADNPHFILQSEPAGNNTASTSATFNVLYSNLGKTAESGFYINPNGTLHFATGQTFPGGTGSGTITKVTAGTDLTGGGSSGAVTLNVDTTKVAVLNGENIFNGTQTVVGDDAGQQGLGASGSEVGLVGVARNTDSGAVGVSGSATTGVQGVGTFGIYGTSTQGGLNSVASAGVLGLYGTLSKTAVSEGNFLVAGVVADGGQQEGMLGPQTGLYATTDDSNAATTENNSSGYVSLIVENDATDGPLLLALNGSLDSCEINGKANLSCTGAISGSNVSAVTGRTVLTYGVQSAENWYEDAGSGNLQNGSAHIDLDATFGDLVNTAVPYHVFLTPHGDSRGLYVTNLTATGFEVRESGGGAASMAFDYRIMAKRKGFEKVRLEDKTEERRQQLATQLKRHPNFAKHSMAQSRLTPMP